MSEDKDKVHILKGKIRTQYNDHCCVHVHDEELGDWMKQFVGKCVTVRYWINDRALETVEECIERTLEMEFGQGAVLAKCDHQYSEITGYLYTNEDAKVGGHDLIRELSSYEKKFVLMEVTVYEGDEEHFHPDDWVNNHRKEREKDPRDKPAIDALIMMLGGEPRK